jgi:tripartite-type tricarboxylate transporter receptor subunit TctC
MHGIAKAVAVAVAGLLFGFVFGLGVAVAAPGDDYPSRPVKWVVAYPPGGTTDILARIIAQYLSDHLGQQFVIDNRPGAGNNIGTEAVVNSPPDGYTLLLVNPANGINATLYKKLSFNFLRDIAPVAGITRTPNVMEVTPSFPAKNVAEFVAYASAHPGKINMASSGNGTSVHLSGELFMAMTGIKMTHVPYRGAAPAITDIIAGVCDVMFDNMPSSIQFIKSGKMRALAVTTDARNTALPDVPTVGETVPGYEASAWFGIGAPRGTPAAIVEKVNRVVNQALADPRVQAQLADLGGVPLAGTPEEFGKVMADETEKWAKAVRFSGASID